MPYCTHSPPAQPRGAGNGFASTARLWAERHGKEGRVAHRSQPGKGLLRLCTEKSPDWRGRGTCRRGENRPAQSAGDGHAAAVYGEVTGLAGQRGHEEGGNRPAQSAGEGHAAREDRDRVWRGRGACRWGELPSAVSRGRACGGARRGIGSGGMTGEEEKASCAAARDGKGSNSIGRKPIGLFRLVPVFERSDSAAIA